MRPKVAALIAVIVVGLLAFALGWMAKGNPDVSSSEVVGSEITELQQEVKDLRGRVEDNTKFRERLCDRVQDSGDNVPDQARQVLDYAAQACQN